MLECTAVCPESQFDDYCDEEDMRFVPNKIPVMTPLDAICWGGDPVPEPKDLYHWHLPGNQALKVADSLCGDVPLNSGIADALFTFVPPLNRACTRCLALAPERWVR